MELPHSDPIGVPRVPAGFAREPRAYSARLRLAVVVVIALFGLAVTGTTVASLGRYCLTTDSGNARALPGSPLAGG